MTRISTNAAGQQEGEHWQAHCRFRLHLENDHKAVYVRLAKT